MQNVYYEVNSLDKRCYDNFCLSEDLLMENAAIGIKNFIEKNFNKRSKILIVSGVGNNGADGIALARMLNLDYEINLYLPFKAKSKMALLQLKRAKLLNVNIVDFVENEYDIVVDSLFGSGLNKNLNTKSIDLIKKLNQIDGYKIACDIPSGVDSNGNILDIAFEANTTITMGALKTSLFSDKAKDYVGEIIVANLGVSSQNYQTNTDIFLLEKKDLKLPIRVKQNSHKGNFGHTNIICGEKEGASLLASIAAFKFGCGLVTLVSKSKKELPAFIMQSNKLSSSLSSISIGMGLGESFKEELKEILTKDTPLVIDADLFYKKEILLALNKKNVVLTPHPKEFVSLLNLCNLANIDIEELQKNRFKYTTLFSNQYPNITLLLKGANTIIAYNKRVYINSFGVNSLSKGGSGDVLSGLIASLLAQNYTPLEATITASLAHSLAAKNYKKNNYALTPLDLIEEITKL